MRLGKSELDHVLQFFYAHPAWKSIPLTMSIDIRRNDEKYTVIDANCFPSGHNNILVQDVSKGAEFLRAYLEKNKISEGSVAIFPEFMTKNPFYGDNLERILEICDQAKLSPMLAWNEELDGPFSHKRKIPTVPMSEALEKSSFIWLNNDLSAGLPIDLKEYKKPIYPNPSLGWWNRKKTNFFDNFNKLILEIESKYKIDLSPMKIQHRVVQVTDLFNETDLNKLYEEAKALAQTLPPSKYNKSLFIKNTKGTFGLGVLGISEPEEILNLNMRKKQNLSLTKDRSGFTEFMIQEGVPSTMTEDGTCEEVVMGLGGQQIARFLRCHEKRSPYESLNAKGMKLVPSTESPCPHCESLLFHLSLLAVALETI